MPVLQFKGKTVVETYHHTVPHHRLEFDAKLSLLGNGEKPSLEGNLIIEGDNLLTLKALLPTHAGKVKCVYIDPPYNTGNEGWVYSDNLTQPQFKEWIGKTVGKEGEDATRHDKWCCMMYPRLELLRQLLTNDGLIFVSIDDIELPRLLIMMEEVFGLECFVACMIWKARQYPDARALTGVSTDHEYIVVYGKSGKELLDEQMIKLPLNIATSGQKNWKDALTQARDKRKALADKAVEYAGSVGPDRLIRPIVLVQVERTGKEQRGNKVGGQLVIHSEDVKEYLIERLSVPETAIAIKSSQTDDIEGIDLLDPDCSIEWIITKSALQEGWDCPFAYILVSLNNTGSSRSMTQLVGRVLRQPYQERTPFDELNESYIYCLHAKASEIARQVKSALEREGYEGDASSVVDASRGPVAKPMREVGIRPEFSSLYTRPFEGKIYLPHFCVKTDEMYEPLDYYRHLISEVNVDRFNFGGIDWPLAQAIAEAKDRFYRITLGEDIARSSETETDLIETDEQVKAWLAASLPFDYFSQKQIVRIVGRIYDRLIDSEMQLKDRLGLVKFVVRDHAERFISDQVDIQTEQAFRKLFKANRVLFYLGCAECRFEIPETITINATQKLEHDNGDPIAKSLFELAERESSNQYEQAIALCIDRHPEVLWWYRNLVGQDNFAIQGYRRNRIRPDFIVKDRVNSRALHTVLVLESKGKHLEGSQDTTYKRTVAEFFEKAGKQVPWQQLGEDFKDHMFRFQILDEGQQLGRDWRDELESMLSVAPSR
jgi:type III restriction enzyme